MSVWSYQLASHLIERSDGEPEATVELVISTLEHGRVFHTFMSPDAALELITDVSNVLDDAVHKLAGAILAGQHPAPEPEPEP